MESDKPDLLIAYKAALTQEREWNANSRGFGFPFDGGTATSSTINVGTLVLGIYDPAAKQLVWTGSASKRLTTATPRKRSRKPEQSNAKTVERLSS